MTTQPNTEPLKVGEQMPTASDALEALDAMDDYARMDTGVDAIGPREVLRAFIQSHNGHAEPSPAEVSGEGLPEPMCVAKGDRFDTYAYTEEQMLELKAERDRWYGAAQERQIEINRLQSLSQQSPARVEGGADG